MFIQCITTDKETLIWLPLDSYNIKIVEMHKSIFESIEIYKEVEKGIFAKVEKIK